MAEIMETKGKMPGGAEFVIQEALGGKAIYTAQFGTAAVYALVVTISECLFLVKTKYKGGEYEVEATCINPAYMDFGTTYKGSVDIHSVPSEHEWKARKGPKPDMCLMCLCTNKTYLLDCWHNNAEHTVVALGNNGFASVIKDTESSVYAGPITFDKYVEAVVSGDNTKKEATTADYITTHLEVIDHTTLHSRTAYVGLFNNVLYMCLEDKTAPYQVLYRAICIDKSGPKFGAVRQDVIIVNAATKWMLERKIVFAPKNTVSVAISRCTDNPNHFLFNFWFENGRTSTVFFDTSDFQFGRIIDRKIENIEGVSFASYLDSVIGDEKAVANMLFTDEDINEAVETDMENQNRNKAEMEKPNHISWNVYFMAMAMLASKRSKDPKTKVGAVIVTPDDHRVVSVGYNGFPYGCSDYEFPWSKGNDLDLADTKYAYVVHAELNAILSARGRDLTGCHIYVTSSPCNECTKAIIQAGIKKIVYMEEYNPGSSSWIASSRMFKAAGVEVERYKPEGVKVDLGEF